MDTLSNTWLTESVKEVLGNYFNEISENIGEAMSKSQKIKDNVSDEEYVTGKLIEIINNYDKLSNYENLKKKIWEETGVYFDIKGWKNNRVDEGEIGADLGIVLNVKTSNYEEQKTIIIQSKKAKLKRGKINYPELEKRGISQANSMLKITPASFFFLYNLPQIIDIDHYKPIISTRLLKEGNYFNDELIFPLMKFRRVITEKKAKAYFGIMVLSANSIASNKKIDSSFETIFPLCISLTEFMVDFFLPCFVGDKRKKILSKAGANPDFIKKIISRFTLEFKISEG